MMRMSRWMLAWALCLAVAAAHAQGWPAKPIRIVIPYAPGGTGDISFRLVSQALEAKLNQRFVVDNKAGASGNVGAADVARSAPDGYTLLLGATNNFVTNQFLVKDMEFDPLHAFVPIAMVSDAPTVFGVSSALPVKTLPEFVAYAKANPGKLNFGSPGEATPPHLAAELLSSLAHIEIVHVPYKGAALAVQGLLAGDVQMYFTAISAIAPHIKSGKVRALAVGGPRRLEALPEVPTTAEAGYPALLTGNWWLMAAPRGTDRTIVERLAGEVRHATADAGVQKRFAEFGMVRGTLSPQELGPWLQSEADRWKKIIDAVGVKAQ